MKEEILKVVKPLEYTHEFETIYKQHGLLIHQMISHGQPLPRYPLELDSEQNISFIPKITNGLRMELNQWFDIYEGMVRTQSSHGDKSGLIKTLYMTNQKLGQSLHYLVSLLYYSNINPSDILSYYNDLMTDMNLKETSFVDGDVLATAMKYGRYCNLADHIFNNPYLPRNKFINQPTDDFIGAGRIITPEVCEIVKTQLFELLYYCTRIDINFTNGNPLQISNTIDIKELHLKVMEIWLHFFKLTDLLGYEETHIGRIYMVTNHLNLLKY